MGPSPQRCPAAVEPTRQRGVDSRSLRAASGDTLASGQTVRHLTLDQGIEGSNPSSPANFPTLSKAKTPRPSRLGPEERWKCPSRKKQGHDSPALRGGLGWRRCGGGPLLRTRPAARWPQGVRGGPLRRDPRLARHDRRPGVRGRQGRSPLDGPWHASRGVARQAADRPTGHDDRHRYRTPGRRQDRPRGRRGRHARVSSATWCPPRPGRRRGLRRLLPFQRAPLIDQARQEACGASAVASCPHAP
jgi:hypothetical protein